jgi:hypothetical protein
VHTALRQRAGAQLSDSRAMLQLPPQRSSAARRRAPPAPPAARARWHGCRRALAAPPACRPDARPRRVACDAAQPRANGSGNGGAAAVDVVALSNLCVDIVQQARAAVAAAARRGGALQRRRARAHAAHP